MEVYLTGELNEDCSAVLLDQPEATAKTLRSWKSKKLDVLLSESFEKRSIQQNKYLHAGILPAVIAWRKERTGERWTNEQAKIYIYSHVLDQNIDLWVVDGKELFFFNGLRFSEMSKKEFNEAKEKVQLFFGEDGWLIPDPK